MRKKAESQINPIAATLADRAIDRDLGVYRNLPEEEQARALSKKYEMRPCYTIGDLRERLARRYERKYNKNQLEAMFQASENVRLGVGSY